MATLLCATLTLLAAPNARAQDDKLGDDAASLINNIRQRLDSCAEDGALAQPSLQRVSLAAPRSRPAVVWHERLAGIAARHGQAMVAQNFFDHVDLKGRTIGQRATEGGYRWRVVGENLAAGQQSIGDAMRGWLLSSTHCRNLIDERFTEFGIARVQSRDPNDAYGTYWVLVMGKPQAPAAQLVAAVR